LESTIHWLSEDIVKFEVSGQVYHGLIYLTQLGKMMHLDPLNQLANNASIFTMDLLILMKLGIMMPFGLQTLLKFKFKIQGDRLLPS